MRPGRLALEFKVSRSFVELTSVSVLLSSSSFFFFSSSTHALAPWFVLSLIRKSFRLTMPQIPTRHLHSSIFPSSLSVP